MHRYDMSILKTLKSQALRSASIEINEVLYAMAQCANACSRKGARIASPIIIAVELTRVVDLEAIVESIVDAITIAVGGAHVANTIAVSVGLSGVGDAGAVIAFIEGQIPVTIVSSGTNIGLVEHHHAIAGVVRVRGWHRPRVGDKGAIVYAIGHTVAVRVGEKAHIIIELIGVGHDLTAITSITHPIAINVAL